MFSKIWPGVPQKRIYYHCSWGPLSTTCSNATEVSHWVTSIVAVDHNQLRTLASETDRIDGSLSPTFMVITPLAPLAQYTHDMIVGSFLFHELNHRRLYY